MPNIRQIHKGGETTNSISENIKEVKKMENPLVQTTNEELLRIKTGYNQHASLLE
jgi:hypothetical protein